MAVNRIYYKDGKKYCVPVTSRKDYFLLRDSNYNLECVEKARRGETFKDKNGKDISYKTKLVQFNYSCYPNEDGTLAKTSRPSDSVAMDIDFHIPSELPEGVTPEKWLQDEILNTIENILNHKEVIKLQMCERSATKGLHIVTERDFNLSQEENLRRIADVLGVSFDEGAKDITRVFFTPTSTDILYIEDSLFRRGEGGTGTSSDGGSTPKTPRKKEAERNETRPEAEKPIKENLIVFDLLVKEAGLDPKALDIFGEHNWHKNLMSIM